jgi:hypothetical protein
MHDATSPTCRGASDVEKASLSTLDGLDDLGVIDAGAFRLLDPVPDGGMVAETAARKGTGAQGREREGEVPARRRALPSIVKSSLTNGCITYI